MISAGLAIAALSFTVTLTPSDDSSVRPDTAALASGLSSAAWLVADQSPAVREAMFTVAKYDSILDWHDSEKEHYIVRHPLAETGRGCRRGDRSLARWRGYRQCRQR